MGRVGASLGRGFLRGWSVATLASAVDRSTAARRRPWPPCAAYFATVSSCRSVSSIASFCGRSAEADERRSSASCLIVASRSPRRRCWPRSGQATSGRSSGSRGSATFLSSISAGVSRRRRSPALLRAGRARGPLRRCPRRDRPGAGSCLGWLAERRPWRPSTLRVRLAVAAAQPLLRLPARP